MKRLFIPLFLIGFFFTSCSKDDVVEEVETEIETAPEAEAQALAVEQFIHRAMADWYLYEAEVPKLQEDYFKNSEEKDYYLASFDSPEKLYQSLKASHDKYSFMWNDYIELENMVYRGIEKTTGMIYAWGPISDGNEVFVIARYVLPNSSSEQAGIKRGDIFTKVNDEQLTRTNYRELLSQDSYTISYAEVKNGTIGLTGETAQLSSSEMAENPVHLVKVIEKDGFKIGYLMYNGFTYDFDPQLNDAFAYFKSQNIDELVIDLRYNGGGSIETASDLASMVTGGYEEKLLFQEMLNKKWQAFYDKEAPENIQRRFNDEIHTGEKINSLYLDKVYVIATYGSASASELLINGLDPYINVIHIGSNTRGKYQGSRTLYDSDDLYFRKKDVNPAHKYAIQPLISKAANAVGRSDYGNGLTPDIPAAEGLNYLPLGDENEPLLKVALNDIFGLKQSGQATATKQKMEHNLKIEGDSKMFNPTYQRMYTSDVPLLK